jgi:hypothetical protein
MTEPTIAELKARIVELEKTAKWFRRMEEIGIRHRSGERRKLTKHEKAQRLANARDRRAFKARFNVGRGSKPGVPKARIVSGGRVESKS